LQSAKAGEDEGRISPLSRQKPAAGANDQLAYTVLDAPLLSMNIKASWQKMLTV